ncbi:hypothetical protein UO65_5169 [Actinokineospora spheciospongiae]|uniref:SnoaL-like domain-containing protein n=1 Tax=Actinokineospora spheciospongiae TaxID=909613 RepID=W7IGW3_9PSEU|nr:ester cyclase [Actinokineospora spheciospongiae]EWC59538.1 hypothetical protein UO65_5169 [Actinokineospora spheciospongiae]PWW51470.1 SnoaL-like polyketide cyclase [Actinokineospora spheciospongiae]
MTATLTATDTATRFAITEAFVREALNEGDLAVVADFAHPGIRDGSGTRLFDDGVRGLEAAVLAIRRSMPDLYARVPFIRDCGKDTVEVHLELTGTYRAPNLAQSGRDGRVARWRQIHRFSFRGALAEAHLGWVDRAAIRACLGEPY